MRIVRTAVAALFVTAVSPAAIAQTDHDMAGHAMSAGETSKASQAYMDAMSKMNEDMDSTAMTGKPGVDFVLMMIPHHQSAIDMAEAYLASGHDDPTLTKLAEDIIAAQKAEIAILESWLEENRQ